MKASSWKLTDAPANVANPANSPPEVSSYSGISSCPEGLSPLIESALWFARRKMPVFQLYAPLSPVSCSCGAPKCPRNGKHPKTANGFKDAITDPSLIRSWSQQKTPFNLGVVMGLGSGFFVLDSDPRHGGIESLANLETKHGKLPETWKVETGGGGAHYWFKHPGGRVPCRVGFRPGLDVRGDGGYVVAPPSQHASGKTYEWDWQQHPDDAPLADAPQWLLDLILNISPPPQKCAGAWRSVFSGKLDEGERNSSITRLTGHLLGKRVDPYVVFELMLAFNEARANPPLEAWEVYQVVRSIVRCDLRQKSETSHGK